MRRERIYVRRKARAVLSTLVRCGFPKYSYHHANRQRDPGLSTWKQGCLRAGIFRLYPRI